MPCHAMRPASTATCCMGMSHAPNHWQEWWLHPCDLQARWQLTQAVDVCTLLRLWHTLQHAARPGCMRACMRPDASLQTGGWVRTCARARLWTG